MVAMTWKSWNTDVYSDLISATAPDSYHRTLWNQQAQVYQEMWQYFDGSIFDETLHDASDDLKYPMKISLFETACLNHRAALFGEFEMDVLRFRVRSENTDADGVEKAINKVWRDSRRNSLLLESGLTGMVLGGTVFRVIWHPVHKRVYIRTVAADAFFPVWDPDDYHRLLECYIVHQVDSVQALRRYNVRVGSGESLHTVRERWTMDFYDVTVDEEQAYWDPAHNWPMSGENPFKDPLSNQGIIPIEYFPRDRGGNFYGIPLGKNMTPLQNAYNERAADINDAVLDATHQHLFLTGRPQGLTGLENLQRGVLNNLGMGHPGGERPDVFAVKGGEIPIGTLDWMQETKQMAREAAMTPPVSYGQDEGSQRSALTLAFRMWPLSSAVRATRGFWTDSLGSLNRKVLIVAAEKGGYNLRTGQIEYETLPMWSPMLPRDREGEINAVSVLMSAGVMSVRTAIGQIHDKEESWIDEEEARIWADKKRQAKIDASAQPAGMMGGGGSSQQSSSPSKVPTS